MSPSLNLFKQKGLSKTITDFFNPSIEYFIKNLNSFYVSISLKSILIISIFLNSLDAVTTVYYLSVYPYAIEKNVIINFFINEVGLFPTIFIKILIIFPIIFLYLTFVSYKTCKICFLAFNLMFLFICSNNIGWILKLWYG